jgi:hypothetical protein
MGAIRSRVPLPAVAKTGSQERRERRRQITGTTGETETAHRGAERDGDGSQERGRKGAILVVSGQVGWPNP